jgi:hypothetical protein
VDAVPCPVLLSVGGPSQHSPLGRSLSVGLYYILQLLILESSRILMPIPSAEQFVDVDVDVDVAGRRQIVVVVVVVRCCSSYMRYWSTDLPLLHHYGRTQGRAARCLLATSLASTTGAAK